MQDSKLINISQAVVGKQGVYSIEFHEDEHYTHVKRSNSDGSETLFSVGGSGGGGGATDYIQNIELINNGLTIDVTGVGNAFNTTLDVSSLRVGRVLSGYLSGNSPATVYTGGYTPAGNGLVNGDWIIDLDTSKIWYLANADTNVWENSIGSGSTGGVTYTAGTGIDITNGVISSTVVDSDTNTEYGITLSSHLSGANLQLLGTDSTVDVVTILPGSGIAMSLASDELTISSTATDTNDFVSSVSLNGTNLEFNGTGGAFSGTVSLASLAGGGSGTESNIVPYGGGTINTDTVGVYGLRESAEKIELVRTVASDTEFVLQAGSSILGTNNFGILVVYVTINCSGTGGIRLRYNNLLNSIGNIHGNSYLTGGNFALTFSYFGTTGLQLLAFTEL